jgi:hypothetical protein
MNSIGTVKNVLFGLGPIRATPNLEMCEFPIKERPVYYRRLIDRAKAAVTANVVAKNRCPVLGT